MGSLGWDDRMGGVCWKKRDWDEGTDFIRQRGEILEPG